MLVMGIDQRAGLELDTALSNSIDASADRAVFEPLPNDSNDFLIDSLARLRGHCA